MVVVTYLVETSGHACSETVKFQNGHSISWQRALPPLIL